MDREPTFTEEEFPIAAEVAGLAFGISMYRALHESTAIPAYAKSGLPKDTEVLQGELAQLAQEHPDIVRRTKLPIDSLVTVQIIEG